jgi:putative FmdB family regulatory protein
MPTYEYKCSACGFEFEKFQSIKSAPIRKCPHCGKNKAKRKIGAGAGLIFKGGGFYITDYRSDAYKNAAKSDIAPAAASTDAKSTGDAAKTTTTDSKPAADTKAAKPEAESKPSKSASKSSKRAK